MISLKGIGHSPQTGRWEVRKVIPADVVERIVLPPDLAAGRRGRGEFKRVLTATTASEAAVEGGAILARLDAAIRGARAIQPLTEFNVLAAISAWDGDPTQAPDTAAYPPTQPISAIAVDTRRILDAMVPAMRALGLDIPADIIRPEQHPALRSSAFEWAQAILETRRARVSLGPTITAVMEKALVANPHNEARQIRYYVRRLTESIGDLPIESVTKPMMTEFRVALTQFPALRSGAAKDSLSFDEILEVYADNDDVPRIIGKTIRTKWCQAYNYVFKFAVEQGYRETNPVSIPQKKWDGSTGRREFSHEEIGRMFSHRRFDLPDRNGLIPVLALWTGMRLSEISGVKVADVKTVDGVDTIDLTHRKLKTAGSSRLVPLHRRLVAFRELTRRLQALGEEYLFPDLPRGGDASAFGKSWGRWMDENGFDDPTTSFHSFRHTFKRACRNARLSEEVHDLLTGHGKNASVGRGYGSGMDIGVLSQALDMIDFPTFPATYRL